MILKEILTERQQLTLSAWRVVMDEDGCETMGEARVDRD